MPCAVANRILVRGRRRRAFRHERRPCPTSTHRVGLSGRDGKKLSISLEGPPTILNSFSQSNDPYATEKRVLTHIGRIVKTRW